MTRWNASGRGWVRGTLLSAMLLTACVAFAQMPVASPGNHPAFAAAVVKPSGPDSGGGIKFQPGGRFVARNASLRLLIKIAYNLNDNELSGGPSWIGVKHFDIDAAPDTPDGGAVDMERNRSRLKALLADRFQLQMRDEMKTMSTYALLVAKGGAKLKAAQEPDAPRQTHMNAGVILMTSATMEQFADAVSDWVGQPVLDKTGIAGKYDLRLEWTPDPSGGQAGSAADGVASQNSYGPTIFTALQEQLGLSLQSRRAQALCKVVERAELPSEN